MSNYCFSINLLKLKKASILKINGKKEPVPCLVIPITDNPELKFLIKEGKQFLFLNCAVYELKKISDYGDTHLIKPSLNKEAFDLLTEEERKAIAIIGNMAPFKTENQTPVASSTATIEGGKTDDLPF